MKQILNFARVDDFCKSIIFIVLFVGITVDGYSQYGNTFSNPIDAGSYSDTFFDDFIDCQNSANFTDNYGAQPSPDIFYKFTISRKMNITITHCGSSISNTFVSLLDASGNLITNNDNYTGVGACGNTNLAQIKIELSAGTYYVVSEGYRTLKGLICTGIRGYAPPGDHMGDPIVAGVFNAGFTYAHTLNTINFSNRYNGTSSKDVFYKFKLTNRMLVTMTHCGAAVSDTYLYLLDSLGNRIAENNNYKGVGACSDDTLHAFIQRSLAPGTYYVVSEGVTADGNITTNISGQVDEFGYPSMPSSYSTEPEGVGQIAGSMQVSSTGAAVYSVPIECPPGVGGLQPSISLSYNSQSGNGIAGYGMNVSGFSVISRGPKTIYHDGAADGIKYDATDAFYLDGQRLIFSSGTQGQEGAIYYPESDPFTKVVLHGSHSQAECSAWFEVNAKNGNKIFYGNEGRARQQFLDGKCTSWYINRIEDPVGNFMKYVYDTLNYYHYLSAIEYGENMNEAWGVPQKIAFQYSTRTDNISAIECGRKITIAQRLSAIHVKSDNNILQTYELNYIQTDPYSRVSSIAKKNADNKYLKPILFAWNMFPSAENITSVSIKIDTTQYFPHASFLEQTFFSAELNGDNIPDLVGIYPFKEYNEDGTFSMSTKARVYKGRLDSVGTPKYDEGDFYNLGASFLLKDAYNITHKGASITDLDGDGINEFLYATKITIDGNLSLNFQLFNDENYDSFHFPQVNNPIYTCGDIDNDSKSEIVIIDRNNNTLPNHKIIIVSYENGSASSTVLGLGMNNVTPKKVFLYDYNGDGLNDLFMQCINGYKIFWNQGPNSWAIYNANSQYDSPTSSDFENIIDVGDFNGDGYMDFLTYSTNWNFQLNNGDGTFTKTIASTLNNYYQDFTTKDDDKLVCNVLDLDHDGKSDVVISKARYVQETIRFNGADILIPVYDKTCTYWLRSNGNSLNQVLYSECNEEEGAKSGHFISNDFNGDGQIELMHFGKFDCVTGNVDTQKSWRLYKNPLFNSSSGKLKNIQNSTGGQCEFEYASMLYGGIYSKGKGNHYPLMDIIPCSSGLSLTRQSNGVSAPEVNVYSYYGARMHLNGRGFLGMKMTKSQNLTTGVITETGVLALDTTYFIPIQTYSKTTVDGDSSKSIINTTIVEKGNKLFFAYPSSKIDQDLDGNVYTTTYTYNTSFGYPTEERTEFGSNAMYKTVQYGNYVLAGGQYKPQLITNRQKHPNDNQEFVNETQVSYNTVKGYPVSKIENYQSDLPLTTQYLSYDNYGNCLSYSTSGTGISTVVNQFEFDASKRFVARAYTSPVSAEMLKTYDAWGNVLTETDATNSQNPLTTTYTYDGWGNKRSVLTPSGQQTFYSSGWNSQDPAKRYFTLVQGKSQTWVKTWYDAMGRETSVETVGPLGVPITVVKTYDNKGQLVNVQNNKGDLHSYESTMYDARGRVSAITNSTGKSVTFSYGNRTVASQENGRSYTKTLDAWGNVIQTSDPVSTIIYSYASSGRPLSINAAGSTTNMTYDAIGNQLTLSEPNSGTTSYTYDALGGVISQTNAKGSTKTNYFDQLNRPSYTISAGVRTDYTYGTSGNEVHRLIQTSLENKAIQYTYDEYGRKVVETRNIDGDQYAYGYHYNNSGLLDKMVYPGYVETYYSYDPYGNLVKIMGGTEEFLQILWELNSETGTATTIKRGDGAITSTILRDNNGLLTNLSIMKGSSVIHNLSYAFDGATGNLSSRTGMISQREAFYYDEMDRLVSVRKGIPEVEAMHISYSDNGNITSKTGLGNYAYQAVRPHAVSGIDNTSGLVSDASQNVWYNNANGKVGDIFETCEDEGITTEKRMTLLYGPDDQRWRGIYSIDGEVNKIHTYMPHYESFRNENGEGSEFIYMCSPTGEVVGVYMRITNEDDEKIGLVNSDYQGNILSLCDKSGYVYYRASYDAWGCPSISTNMFNFRRGYTGHEHMYEFELINMNGRVYDPKLGRFLSPDNYVQSPENSQNYNRYSYCLNNPLIYTDPSGDFFFLIPNIGWSKSGGLSVGVTAIVGIPGIASVQAGVGYSFKSNDFNTTVGATAAFNTVYASYSTQSGFSVGWSAGLSPHMGIPISTNFTSVGANYNISHDSWSGNVSAWGIDKDGWSFNPSVSAMVYPEQTTNLVRGQGFSSNDAVLNRFVANGQHQRALAYFGFKGTYDPSIENPGQFDPKDASIKYNNVAFSKNYDYLRSIYEEELFHSQDYLTYKSKMPADISDKYAYEEFRAQVHLYKNQGLYYRSGTDWGLRINMWGSAAGVNPDIIFKYNFFSPKWHLIYKIPRRW